MDDLKDIPQNQVVSINVLGDWNFFKKRYAVFELSNYDEIQKKLLMNFPIST